MHMAGAVCGLEVHLKRAAIQQSPFRLPPRWIWTGSAASVVSTLMLALCGLAENGRAVAPSNGPSQWVWGRHAARSREVSLRRTGVGYLIHHLSSLMWASVHHQVFRRPAASACTDLARGLATASIAAFVDYRVTPRRFQPGFEQHLSVPSLVLVYAAFGITLGLTNRWLAK